jgi:hypothetical protein
MDNLNNVRLTASRYFKNKNWGNLKDKLMSFQILRTI